MTFSRFINNRYGQLMMLCVAALAVGAMLLYTQAAGADSVPRDLSQSTLTVNRAQQGPGGRLSFTLTVMKSSGAAVESVAAVNTLPVGLTLVPGSAVVSSLVNADQDAFSVAGQTITWSGSMFNDGTAVIRYDATVDADVAFDTALTTAADITADSGQTALSAPVLIVDRPTGPTDIFLPVITNRLPGLCYQEENEIVILDVETQVPNGWIFTTEESGYAGQGYYVWPGGEDDILGRRDVGILEYMLQIENPGTYTMRFYTYDDHSHLATEANDIYTAMDDGHFEKTVSWSYQYKEWGWATGREIEENGREVQNPPEFELSRGIHTFKVAARSSTFGIDRFAFYKDKPRNDDQADRELTPMPTSDLCVGYDPPIVEH